MLDDPLREQLAAWVHPVTSRPIPDIRVLRRRARRRGIRRAVTAAAIAAVVAAVAVGVTVGLAGTGRAEGGRPVSPPVSPPSWPKAPGTWHPGAWRAAGPLPAADAAPAAQPYIVLLPVGRGTAQVRNMFTGKTIADHPRRRTDSSSPGSRPPATTARSCCRPRWAGRRRTPRCPSIPPPPPSTSCASRRTATWSTLSVLGTVPAQDRLSGFAISQDASMLAYFTGAGFETVSLRTGTGKHWLPVDHGVVAPYSLSWAGDRTVAFEWGSGNNPHPPGMGIRVLNVAAPGNLLQASRLVVSYGRYCGARAACQDGQLITPDGSRVLVTRVVGPDQHYTDSVVEYSVRTGQQLAQVMPTVRTPYAGPPCVPLWTNPSGQQVISFCGGHGERYDHGHLSRITLHPPMYGMNFGAAFAW